MIATAIRKGTALVMNGELYIVTDFFHGTPGKGRGFVQISLKGVKTGKTMQKKLASDEDVERAFLEAKQCQFMYKDEMGFHFMDMETYHTFPIGEALIGDGKYYLLENMEIKIQFHGEEPVIPELPKTVVLKVTESPPWVKGDSVSNNLKPAVCETGLKIQVPIFIEEGTDIKVSTETGEYLGRAN